METIRKDFEGFNFKHKQAIQLLDAKQVKMVELMSRLEKDMKVQLDQKMQVLEQNDITQQKELAGANEQIRDLKSRLVAVVNEVDQKVLTQQQIQQKAIEDQQRQINNAVEDAKLRQEQYVKEIKPTIEAVNVIDERVKKLVEFSQGMDKRISNEIEERKHMGTRLQEAMHNLKDLEVLRA